MSERNAVAAMPVVVYLLAAARRELVPMAGVQAARSSGST